MSIKNDDAAEIAVITVKEKTVALGLFGLSSFGIGSSAAIETYLMIVAEASNAGPGMGIGISAALVPYCALGVGVVAFLISIGVGFYLYRDYTSNAASLNANILYYIKRNQELEDSLQKAKINYFISVLRFYIWRREQRKNNIRLDFDFDQQAFQTDLDHILSPRLLRKLHKFVHHQSNLNLVDALEANLYCGGQNLLINNKKVKPMFDLFIDDMQKFEALDGPLKVTKPKILHAIFGGLIVMLDVFGISLGGAIAVSSLIVGTFTLSALATPVVGWGMLAGSIVMGLVFGAAYSYYKYKNCKREAERERLEAENNSLTSKRDVVHDRIEKLNTAMLNSDVKQKMVATKVVQTPVSAQAEIVKEPLAGNIRLFPARKRSGTQTESTSPLLTKRHGFRASL